MSNNIVMKNFLMYAVNGNTGEIFPVSITETEAEKDFVFHGFYKYENKQWIFKKFKSYFTNRTVEIFKSHENDPLFGNITGIINRLFIFVGERKINVFKNKKEASDFAKPIAKSWYDYSVEICNEKHRIYESSYK